MGTHRIVEAAREAVSWTLGEGKLRVTLPGQPAREMTIAEYERRDALLRERAELEAANAAHGSWGGAVGARLERIRAIDAALAGADLGAD